MNYYDMIPVPKPFWEQALFVLGSQRISVGEFLKIGLQLNASEVYYEKTVSEKSGSSIHTLYFSPQLTESVLTTLGITGRYAEIIKDVLGKEKVDVEGTGGWLLVTSAFESIEQLVKSNQEAVSFVKPSPNKLYYSQIPYMMSNLKKGTASEFFVYGTQFVVYKVVGGSYDYYLFEKISDSGLYKAKRSNSSTAVCNELKKRGVSDEILRHFN